MQKILIFADSFLPGYKGGGPVTSIANLVTLLEGSFETLICTTNHDFGDDEVYTQVVSDKITTYQNYHVIYLSKLDIASIKKVLDEFKPDLLYLNSFFSATTQRVMMLNLFLKKKIVLAPRGELQTNALAIKSLKKSLYLHLYKFFRVYKNICFHSTDIIETTQIKSLFVTDNVVELPNAVKVEHFAPLEKSKNELKTVFISRISRKKNLLYALEILLDIEFDMVFDIYGPKEDEEYWRECESVIKKLPQNVKVSYKGALKPSEIKQKLREYHLFFFPTMSENFGHVIVEAMQSGLVTLISDQTPWDDLKHSGSFDIPLDDKTAYKNALKRVYGMSNEEYAKASLAIMEYIDKKLDVKSLGYGYRDFFIKAKKGYCK